MTSGRSGLLLAAMLVPLASAGAQPTHLGPMVTGPAAERQLSTFSRCVAVRWPDRAAAILALDFRTEEYRRRIRAFAQDVWRCAPRGVLRFSQLPFAGNMAEALLPRRLAGRDLAAAVAFDAARPPVAARSESELMSLCVVRTAPAKVAALLATRAGSSEEVASFGPLMGDVSGCVAAGAQMRLDRVGLRAMLALAAYRLVDYNSAPAPAPAAPH